VDALSGEASGRSAGRPPTLSRSPIELKGIIHAERSGVPFLVWRDDAGIQQILSLGGCSNVAIGRGTGSDLKLADDEASRTHAELRRVGVEWTIEDDGLSRNGTFVNEELITQRRRLADKDVMRFGRTVIEYRCPRGNLTDVTSAGSFPALTLRLTEAQKRILIALCRPYKVEGTYATPASNSQIAAEAFIGVDAVKNHLRILFQRFEIADLPQNQKRARLAECALRWGLVSEKDL
jgi:hypothetical protein